ncbi:unnamed protein product [Lupinus luteus]|uniref:Uncharacterized protein n=1 Tax=Lupinus luteus TaxID=3873 RepID=A0AAV1XI49_LUPLU
MYGNDDSCNVRGDSEKRCCEKKAESAWGYEGYRKNESPKASGRATHQASQKNQNILVGIPGLNDLHALYSSDHTSKKDEP